MRRRRILIFAALSLGVAIIVGGLADLATGVHRTTGSHATTQTASPTTTSAPTGDWRPVAPATTVPEGTPVQQQYDKGFEEGFSSPVNEAMLHKGDALALPGPAIAGGWPDLAVSATPDGWATEFTSGLLDIDFALQSYGALGAWLVAEEAPDLLPGIPNAFANRALYVSLLEPTIIGQPSPVPSPGQWRADAAAGVRWSASALEVQLDPQWQQMIDAGWQPPDIRAAVEDVSGVLKVTKRGASTTRRFSLLIQVGSARWRDGYGTVLVSDWTVYSR
jgi:hypothetical protein